MSFILNGSSGGAMTKFATPPLPIHKYKQSLPAFTATRKSVSQPTTSPFASRSRPPVVLVWGVL